MNQVFLISILMMSLNSFADGQTFIADGSQPYAGSCAQPPTGNAEFVAERQAIRQAAAVCSAWSAISHQLTPWRIETGCGGSYGSFKNAIVHVEATFECL